MPESSDSDRQDDLAATADSLRKDAQRVVEIEEQKQDLDINDPRLVALSNEAEHLAGQIQHKSRIERHLSEGSEDDGGSEPDSRSN